MEKNIILAGVGGQGILSIAFVIDNAAMDAGFHFKQAEVHGMAQRGGTVVSHFKVGDFSSPLIRPFQADALLVLKDENIVQHGSFLKKEGWAVVNSGNDLKIGKTSTASGIDADKLAQEIANPKSVNLIMLGFALAKAGKKGGGQINLFCTLTDIKKVLRKKFSNRKKLIDASIKALDTGFKKCLK